MEMGLTSVQAPLISSARPSTQTRSATTIFHGQLRDLIHCPRERGIIYTVEENHVVQYNMRGSLQDNRTVLHSLEFVPNALAFSPYSNLWAAASSDAKLTIGTYPTSSLAPTKPPWTYSFRVLGRTISNAVHWAALPSTSSFEETLEGRDRLERLIISSNDHTVKLYNVATGQVLGPGVSRTELAGNIEFETPVNHTSVSPDGRILLSVGDAAYLEIHALSSHTRNIETSKLHRVSTSTSYNPSQPTAEGLFTSAFSPCGRKFAVGSQDGVVSIWDVRYLKSKLALLNTTPRPLPQLKIDIPKEFNSPAHRSQMRTRLGEGCSFWRVNCTQQGFNDRNECLGKLWGVRSLKFSNSGRGREVLIISEETNNIHVVDARTFDEESRRIIHLPDVIRRNPLPRVSEEYNHVLKEEDDEMDIEPPAVPASEDLSASRPRLPSRQVTVVDVPSPISPPPISPFLQAPILSRQATTSSLPRSPITTEPSGQRPYTPGPPGPSRRSTTSAVSRTPTPGASLAAQRIPPNRSSTTPSFPEDLLASRMVSTTGGTQPRPFWGRLPEDEDEEMDEDTDMEVIPVVEPPIETSPPPFRFLTSLRAGSRDSGSIPVQSVEPQVATGRPPPSEEDDLLRRERSAIEAFYNRLASDNFSEDPAARTNRRLGIIESESDSSIRRSLAQDSNRNRTSPSLAELFIQAVRTSSGNVPAELGRRVVQALRDQRNPIQESSNLSRRASIHHKTRRGILGDEREDIRLKNWLTNAIDQWEEVLPDITGITFCQAPQAAADNGWWYVGTQGRIMEFGGVGFWDRVLEEEADYATEDIWAMRWVGDAAGEGQWR